jgi:hypothetical protein
MPLKHISNLCKTDIKSFEYIDMRINSRPDMGMQVMTIYGEITYVIWFYLKNDRIWAKRKGLAKLN